LNTGVEAGPTDNSTEGQYFVERKELILAGTGTPVNARLVMLSLRSGGWPSRTKDPELAALPALGRQSLFRGGKSKQF